MTGGSPDVDETEAAPPPPAELGIVEDAADVSGLKRRICENMVWVSLRASNGRLGIDRASS